jgi:molecular chaperone GrpE
MKGRAHSSGPGKGEGRPPAGGTEKPAEQKPFSFRVVDRRFSASPGEAGAGEEKQERLPTHVERLERLLEEKDRKFQEALAALKKVQDEYEAFKIRLRKESAKEIETGRRAVLVEILGIVDNFDRALQAGEKSRDFDSLLEGIELVRAQLLDTMAAFGVTRMDSNGRRFDPALHEVVTQVPVRSQDQEGVIVGLISEGYLLGGTLLRPARVAVGKYDDKQPDAE